MNTLRRVMFASASAVALAVGFGSQASAQTVYGAGASLPSVAFRELFNCFGADIRTAANPFLPSGCTAPVNNPARLAYATTGSGGGLRGYALHDPIAPGSVSGSNVVPYADNGSPAPSPLTGISYPFATHHFSSSESPLTPVNFPHPVLPNVVINNSANQTLNCFYGDAAATGGACTVDQRVAAGEAMVLPHFATTVGLVGNFGGVAKTVKLSRTSVCAILDRSITDWNAPQITADNGGVSITGGVSRAIKVVVRADSSGTIFLAAQAFESFCTPGRTKSSFFPNGFNYHYGVSTLPSWPVPFWRASGNNGVAATVASTPWSIGLLSPDFHQPQVATIQVFAPFDVVNGNGVKIKTLGTGATTTSPVNYPAYLPAAIQNIANKYRTPTPYSANRAMLSTTPPAAGAARLNPVNWFNAALSGVNPTDADAYPISGFGWLLTYTCYNNTGSNAGVATAIRNYLSWYLTGSGNSKTILNANGFGQLPTAWMSAVRAHALTTAASRISIAGPGATNTNCTSKTGA